MHFKHQRKTVGKLLLASFIFASSSACAEEPIPTINVNSTAIKHVDNITIKPSEQDYIPTDAADILTSVPGANVNKNGPLTGITQYRGMFGSRVNVQIDGLNIAPAGPNWMDPPLSHVTPSELESISIIRGISPVSAGAESIGGSIQAITSKLAYSTNDDVVQHGKLNSGYDSNNKAYNLGAKVGISTDRHRFQIKGGYAKGQDMQDGRGQNIVPTLYQRQNLGLDYGHRFNLGDFNLSYHNERVDNSGSPALPMDIIYVKGDTVAASFKSNTNLVGIKWAGDIHYIDTDHMMNNYSLRTAPVMLASGASMKRSTLANAKDFSYKLHANIPTHYGTITLGTDAWITKHNADVMDPSNAAFSLKSYNNVTRNRFSLFTEWQSELTDSFDVQAGARYSNVNMNSDSVASSGFTGMMAAPIKALANNFNNAQRRQKDHLIDLSLQLTQRINDQLSFKIGAERKQRAPSYQERYLWSPLESTAGLADKRTYMGDINLSPETAYNIDVGLEWQSDHAYFTPHIFYKRVNNYIQGTPLSSGTASNFRKIQGNMLKGGNFCTNNPLDPFCVPLQFSNVEAELYGTDIGLGGNLSEQITIDGNISYVRGKRKDISDNLYRIAPLNSKVGLSYFADSGWSVTSEGQFYGKQKDVSQSNSEQKTAGYSLFNLSGRYAISRYIEVSSGVNNVFDRYYQSHLSGYNRVSSNAAGETSSVAKGARLPGEGRSFFIRASASF
ncbi:MAG: TonB-dependent receptor [Mariprofundaceae bacterium]